VLGRFTGILTSYEVVSMSAAGLGLDTK